ncbi:hypothetical protein IZU99_06325 [Oscillospiraceae bacterium CM]|nr:hypothetical protein IZU99_06325 [Oscillospiraceae bacterium CM]
MLALLLIPVILLLLAILRLGAEVVYGADGFSVRVFIGPAIINVNPPQTPKKKPKKKPKEKTTPEKKQMPGRAALLKEVLPTVAEALGRLKRRLLIKELTIFYEAASGNPAETALLFGASSVGFGFLIPILENNFKIRRRDFRSSFSFDSSEPYIYVKARLSLAVWEVIYIAFNPALALLKSGIHEKGGLKHG